ncbi:hypothetical protein D3C87_1956290 [compost metagenome]
MLISKIVSFDVTVTAMKRIESDIGFSAYFIHDKFNFNICLRMLIFICNSSVQQITIFKYRAVF